MDLEVTPQHEVQYHRILREVLRNYVSLRSLCADRGEYTIEQDGIVIFLPDLQGALRRLSHRKKEAVFYNVILDMKQKDVAAIMGITTVSVGQYVEQAMLQLCHRFFPEFIDEHGELIEQPRSIYHGHQLPEPNAADVGRKSQHARFVRERQAC